jgi:DNA-binding protein H-NS
MSIDISGLSIPQLEDLKSKAEKRIVEIRDIERDKAVAEARALLASRGFSLDDLTSKKRKSKGAAVAKYRNPADASQVWVGRGKRPEWFKQALAAGKSAKDLAI